METIKKTIWADLLGEFNEKVARLNKVMVKLGKRPVEVRIVGERAKTQEFTTVLKTEGEVVSTEKKTREIRLLDIEIVGESVVKKDDKDYKYIGRVTFDEGVKFIDCVDNGYIEYFGDKFREGVCDHCGTTRKRNSYCLFVADGNVIQIGSTCVEKYFGISVNKYLETLGDVLNVFEDCPNWDEFVKSRGGDNCYLPFEEVAAMTDCVTQGFKVWKKCDEYGTLGTADTIRQMIRDCKFEYAEHKRAITREEAISYWAGQNTTAFSLNVLSALNAEWVPMRFLGVYIYGIFAAGKDKYTQKIQKETSELNEHYGNVGEKIEHEMVLDRVSEIDGIYGPTFVCNFHDKEGRKFVWFASRCPDVDCGVSLSVKGTVKKHEEFNGTKQTVITRCKIAA